MIKKTKKKIFMGIIIAVFSTIIGLFLILIIGGTITKHFVYTPSFKDNEGKVLQGSIAEYRLIKLGGYPQAVLIRGRNVNNPVLLFLPSGPGISETGMFRNMHSHLEDYYTMVYLDPRGAAKSASLCFDYSTLNTQQLIQDIHELTLYLKKRFNKEKIVIMGHSFGAGFGTLSAAFYPHDYSAFIGIGEPVCPTEIDRLSYSWTIEQAKKTNNQKALKELESVNGYWTKRDQKGYFNGMMVNKKYVGYYGGQLYGKQGFLSFILKNMMCHEYNIFDYGPYLLGMQFTGPATWNIMITTDLRQQAKEFQCQFILFTGRHDYNAVPSLVFEYYNYVKAPLKKMYWFEKSAHFPHFEEKELFQKIMIEEILPIINK
jgi:pimeloyl-ACP methyl ester carboxylesterase